MTAGSPFLGPSPPSRVEAGKDRFPTSGCPEMSMVGREADMPGRETRSCCLGFLDVRCAGAGPLST